MRRLLMTVVLCLLFFAHKAAAADWQSGISDLRIQPSPLTSQDPITVTIVGWWEKSQGDIGDVTYTTEEVGNTVRVLIELRVSGVKADSWDRGEFHCICAFPKQRQGRHVVEVVLRHYLEGGRCIDHAYKKGFLVEGDRPTPIEKQSWGRIRVRYR